jgi:hypothetical protein
MFRQFHRIMTVTMNNFRSTWNQFIRLFPWLLPSFLATVAVATIRYFQLNDLATMALSIVFFSLGFLLAHVLFWFEPQFNQVVDKLGSLLAHEEVPAPIEEPSSVPPTPVQQRQVLGLRHFRVLWILPIIAIYLLSSSRSPLGFGFLLGISLIYAFDIIRYVQGKFPEYTQIYFTEPPSAGHLRNLLNAYLIYCVLLILALLIL